MYEKEHRVSTTPHITDRNRKLFEHAYQTNDTIRSASIELDTGLDALAPARVRGGLVVVSPIDADTFGSELARLSANAITAIETAVQKKEGSWNDFFRLLAQVSTVNVRARAEASFMALGEFDQRKELVNGVAARYANTLKYALGNLDAVTGHADATTDPLLLAELATERQQLVGSISELTLLSLANYDEVPSRLALTPKIYDDLYGKTDMVIYHIRHREKESYRVPAQIKTSRRELQGRDIPEGGFALFMSDYDPSGTQNLARALVMHFDNPSELPERAHQAVLAAKEKLKADISQHLTSTPGERLPRIDTLPGETLDARRRIAQLLNNLTASLDGPADEPAPTEA